MTGDALAGLLAGDGVRWLLARPDGGFEAEGPPPAPVALLSGSFNPLHEGHEQLAGAAARLLGRPVTFELAVVNADKPPLRESEVRARLEQFRGRAALLLTRAPRFVEKARLFPGATFVIGWDTAIRLVHPRFYEDSEAAMRAALQELRAAGCRFAVAGRHHEGDFRTLGDVELPPAYASLFLPIAEAEFRADISSTDLRARR